MITSIFRKLYYFYWPETYIWSKTMTCYANSAFRWVHNLPSICMVATEPILCRILELPLLNGKFVAIGIISLAISLEEVIYSVLYSVSKNCMFLESLNSFQTTIASSLKIPFMCKLTTSRFPSFLYLPCHLVQVSSPWSQDTWLIIFFFYSVPYTI